MDAERHIRNKKALELALNGKLEEVSDNIEKMLMENNLDSTPEIAFDVFAYTLERMHLKKFNYQKFVP